MSLFCLELTREEGPSGILTERSEEIQSVINALSSTKASSVILVVVILMNFVKSVTFTPDYFLFQPMIQFFFVAFSLP